MVNWLTDKVGVVEGAVNIGMIRDDSELLLVDTGIDNSAVNKARKSVDDSVSGAFITHHHADHMGGCSKLEKLGVEQIYAPHGELELVHNPFLEPYTMFGGAIPPQSLQNRHLEARPAVTTQSTTEQDIVEVIATPGHTIDHQSFKYGDVIFTGDSAFTQETIDKYKLLFAVDPKQAMQSAQTLKEIDFDIMIPGHGDVQLDRGDAADVLDATAEHYQSIRQTIVSIIGEQLSYAEYIPTVLDHLSLREIINDRGFMQYILYQVPINGYLSNLLDDEIVSISHQTDELVITAN